MISTKIRETILTLHESGTSIREIARILKIARNSVRQAIRDGIAEPAVNDEALPQVLEKLLPLVYQACNGNAVRIQEVLDEDHGMNISYSTLTRLIRAADLRKPRKRSGEYHFDPGEEMQHDTSPHKIIIGDKKVTAQCASLVLAYSRRIFVRYYPRFTRFEAKVFLKEAIEYMGGCAKTCVVDNTSVILASGAGCDAIIAKEMATVLGFYGGEFIAHAVGHADRKARVERPFFYIEKNFLSGRNFMDWDDLNRQARRWCDEVSNKKIKRSLGMSPNAAYVHERPHLIPLPQVLPEVYEIKDRTVDSGGYIHLDKQRYSVPEKLIGRQMQLYKHLDKIEIYWRRENIAKHPRLVGKQNQRSVIDGHHKPLTKKRRNEPCEEERLLREGDEGDLLKQYLDELKRHSKGRGVRQFKRLLNLKRTYAQKAFIQAIKHALHYGLYDLNRLEYIILKNIAGDFFNLPGEEK